MRKKESHKEAERETERQTKRHRETEKDRHTARQPQDCRNLYNCMHYISVNNFMQFFKFYSQIYSYFCCVLFGS